MRKKIKFLQWVIGFLLITCALTSEAQTPVRILCDATFDQARTERPLPGTVYRVLRNEDGRSTHRVERVTQAGTETLEVPLPPELIGKVFVHVVSPDGRYLALSPREHNIPFVVWKIGTSELATVMLPAEDVDYLNENIVPPYLREQAITWVDNTHLLIQYFDLEVVDRYDHLLATKTLTVIDTPFQIIAEPRANIMYPTLSAPPESSVPRPLFSPQNNYVTLVSAYVLNRFQIYDLQGGQPVLVADLQSNESRGIASDPIWTPDDRQFFMLYSGEGVKYGVLQVDATQGFQVNDTLQRSLDAAFGQDVTVPTPAFIILNPSGTRFVFLIYMPITQQTYLISYHVDTGDITAICGVEAPYPSKYTYPIWGPEGTHFGYWTNGWVMAYDLDTGRAYAADGTGFIGWIAGDPPPAPAGQAVISFTLIDAGTDQDLRPLRDGDILRLNSADIDTRSITIRAETEPPIVGSVVFGLNEEPRYKVENEPAYALKGDDNGDYHAWLAEPGTYTLTATPYTEADGGGEVGTPLTITFTVEAPGS